jgi:predicted acetyltransferase
MRHRTKDPYRDQRGDNCRRITSQVGTTQSELTLRRLPRDEEAEFLRAYRATSPEFPAFAHYYDERMLFRRYLEVLAERERGINLPPGHVSSTFLFAFVEKRIVGRTSIRHTLNDDLARAGGHIGYVVVPEFRRRGHATTILRMSLQVARELYGIHRVLVTCDDDNVASIRTIEKNGGVLENAIEGPDLARPKRRYWIDNTPLTHPNALLTG